MTTTTYNPPRTSQPTIRRRTAGVIGAAATAAAVYVAGSAAGTSYILTTAGQSRTLQFKDVVGVAIMVGLLGWASRAGLERVTHHAARIWNTVAGVVLAASFLPIAAVHPSAATAVSLSLIHLVVGGTLISAFRRS